MTGLRPSQSPTLVTETFLVSMMPMLVTMTPHKECLHLGVGFLEGKQTQEQLSFVETRTLLQQYFLPYRTAKQQATPPLAILVSTTVARIVMLHHHVVTGTMISLTSDIWPMLSNNKSFLGQWSMPKAGGDST